VADRPHSSDAGGAKELNIGRGLAPNSRSLVQYHGGLPTVLLIPAYRPGPELPKLIEALGGRGFGAIIIVDDGSGPEYAGVFGSCRATLLAHTKNLGKGAALKTGMAHAAAMYPGCGVVTADADGQHDPDDILRVASRMERDRNCLVLGARQFDGDVPARSRMGNRVAGLMVHALMGQRLEDTQTGLRGVPQKLLADLIAVRSNGYEFELDMLAAAKHLSVRIVEEPIRTIYEPGNPKSHFQPFRDSMRIGFVLMRFSLLSLATAAVDNGVFVLGIHTGFAPATAQIVARAAAVFFNYPLARRAVFFSRQPHAATFSRFLILVVASGFLSYHLLVWFHQTLGWTLMVSKMAAESALFLVNFLVQRDFVFKKRHRKTES
jgi:putative flippase GtrA